MLLPLSILQLALAMIYRLYLFDASAVSDTIEGGWAWNMYGIPFGVPLATTLISLIIFFIYLNDEDKSTNTERIFHVRTLEPAGKHVAGTD